MSTTLDNDAGDSVAVRYFGGRDRGTLVDVHMPRSVAQMVGSMPVFEETTPDLRTTLSGWIADMESAGHTVRFEGEPRLRRA